MKTKNNLELVKSGYIGLQAAQEQTNKVLRNMRVGTPIHYITQESETTTITTYQGNGIKTTVIVEKGGRR